MTYRMALDQGTTSSRCIIFNEKSEIVSLAAKEFPQHFPRAGWVEHDAEDVIILPGDILHRFLSSRRPPKKLVHADLEQLRQPWQHRHIRAALIRLPFADRLIGYIQFLRQLFLGQAQLFPLGRDDIP